MHERLYKARQKNPNIDKEFMDEFSKIMPELLDIMLDGKEYNKHIGSKEVAMLAEKYITNNKGENIGFHWTYEEVMSAIKGMINIDSDDVEFYPGDIFVWSNVKYGDMAHITSDAGIILKYAIAELTDPDFPYYPASQRAYCWLKKHIEESERQE